jgi:hypothetical protein
MHVCLHLCMHKNTHTDMYTYTDIYLVLIYLSLCEYLFQLFTPIFL